jgi:PhnB protein
MPKGLPEGMHTVTPAMTLDGAAEAIEFFRKAFGAEELNRAEDPSGKKVWHAAIRIGDSTLFVNDPFPEQGAAAHASKLWVYSEDVDAAFKRAVDAGGKPGMPPTDMFWGDRVASISDRWGNNWTLATRKENLSEAEMKKRQAAAVKEWQEGKK